MRTTKDKNPHISSCSVENTAMLEEVNNFKDLAVI